MDEIVNEFLVESHEMLDDIDQSLVLLEERPDDTAVLEAIFRGLHTIKGTCSFLGFERLEKVAHAGENLLSLLRDGELVLNASIADALLATIDALRSCMAAIEATESDEGEDHGALIEVLHTLAEPTAADTNDIAADAESVRCSLLREMPIAETEVSANDKSGRSTLLGQMLIDAGVSAVDIEIAAAEQAMGDPRMIGEIVISQRKASQDDVANALVKQHSNRDKGSSAAGSTIRVDVALLDQLMNLVGELVLTRNEIVQLVDNTRSATFSAPSQRLNIITSELQEGVMKTRMQPIGDVWGKLPRVVRDLSHQMGKSVRIEMDGKDTELDKTIIEAIKDPLTHIVRNTVDHGIETPEQRLAAGKPREGVLRLRANHEGGKVNIEISDDGAGIPLDAIKAKAVERGLITADIAEYMSDAEATHLIFLPGFSTAAAVTNVSGRGVGMDVVKTNIEKIGGSVDVRTVLGEGTTFKIKIPLTLAIIPALSVLCGGNRYAIPQINLIELVRVEASETSAGIEFVHGAPVYRLRGRLLPIVDLRDVLGAPNTANAVANVVVLQADDRQFGVVVDEIHETQEIVVKPLGQVVADIPLYSGATILGDGRVAVILDVLGLAQHAGIISAHGEANPVHDFLDPAEVRAPVEMTTLLLLGVGEGRRVALPLSDVARLEEFPLTSIEQSGHRSVVQYRGRIMPLVDLGTSLGYGGWYQNESQPVSVVVYRHRGRDVGLIVGEILDIVQHDLSGETTQSIVIGDRVTDLFDVAGVVAREIPSHELALMGVD